MALLEVLKGIERIEDLIERTTSFKPRKESLGTGDLVQAALETSEKAESPIGIDESR